MSQSNTQKTKRTPDDQWIIEEMEKTKREVTNSFEKYRLNEAAQEIYDFIWHKFADIYLEEAKRRRAEAQKTLEAVLKDSLKMLHPLMPFVTEKIWQEGKDRFGSDSLIAAPWPKT